MTSQRRQVKKQPLDVSASINQDGLSGVTAPWNTKRVVFRTVAGAPYLRNGFRYQVRQELNKKELQVFKR